MEEIKNIKQEKSRKKQFVVSLMVSLAIISFLLGILDIKSNAAESNTIIFSIREEQENLDTGAINYYGPGKYTVTSQSEMEMYVYQSHFERTTERTTTHFFIVSDSPISMTCGSSSYTSKSFTQNGKTRYCIHHGDNYPNTTTMPHFYRLTFETEVNYKSLTTSYYHKQTDFINDYINDNLGFVIDYDNLEIDESLPVVNNVLRNEVVNNMKDSTLEIIVPDTYRYDYITWNNTSELELQIEICPVLQYYKGILEKDYVKEYQGEWLKSDILTSNTENYLWLTRITSIEENFPEFSDWFYSTRDKYYPDWNEILNFTYGYRIRYVDKDNLKAGLWVYIVPDKKFETYKTYIEYLDNSLSNSVDANGSQEVYENLDNIDDALVDVDKENDFKDKYEIVDGDVDVQEATNWLYSVVNFIKGTPQVVGSVLGFLPQPILYGMFVCIFLGIIASGIAIVKALF